MNNDFIDLKQLDESHWQAKYHGNYGVYTVKVALDKNGKHKSFSCTCPSDYSPCKHIGYLQEYIESQRGKLEFQQQQNQLTVVDVLQYVELDELRAFVAKKAQFDAGLTKAIVLEWGSRAKAASLDEDGYGDDNYYRELVRDALDSIDTYIDDYEEEGRYWDYDGTPEIDVSILDEWITKAEEYAVQHKYADALMICKACIEEYADWYQALAEDWESDYPLEECIYENSHTKIFKLLQELATNENTDSSELYDYAKVESQKAKYDKSTKRQFNDLMASLADKVNPQDFVKSQKDLLRKISDKSSSEARLIILRLINFYRSINQPENADELIEGNTQIAEFCKSAVLKRIDTGLYSDAKALINKYVSNNPNTGREEWNELLFTIAQKENDIPEIRRLALYFIERHFNEDTYRIYKSTFSDDEWSQVFENLYQQFAKKSSVPYSIYESANLQVADLLVAEGLLERLMELLEKRLSINALLKYHRSFSGKYPTKSLKLFRKTLDKYLDNNTGRDIYERAVQVLKEMKTINGGNEVVAQMVGNYRKIYNNRRAMKDVFTKAGL